MTVPEPMKALKGWKYPLYLNESFFRAPELIETLVEHGLTRELIRNNPDDAEAFDFFAVVRPNPKDYDEIHIFMILKQDRDELARPTSRSLHNTIAMRIVHPDWYKRKEQGR